MRELVVVVSGGALGGPESKRALQCIEDGCKTLLKQQLFPVALQGVGDKWFN